MYDEIINKPPIDDVIEHYGVKGMRWGVRKDRGSGKGSIFKRKKQGATNRDEALEKRDLKYISKHKNEFSTNELNNLMNRINTEQRIDQLYDSSKKSKKVTGMLKKAAKIVAPVGIAAFAVAALSYKSRVREQRYLVDKKSTALASDVINDFAAVFFDQLGGKIPIYKDVRKYDAKRLSKIRGKWNPFKMM